MPNHSKLYQIEEFPEVWSDGCLRDSDGRFMFLSLYGRDGSLMQFIAAMELSGHERGVSRFHLVNSRRERHPVDVGDKERLTKHAGKLPRQNLFGPLNHLWVFDKSLQQPDRANRIGWALHYAADGDDASGANALQARAWQTIMSLSPVALLDHWRKPVLEWCAEKCATQLLGDTIYPALGPVQAMRVSLSDHFTTFISDAVKQGVLTL